MYDFMSNYLCSSIQEDITIMCIKKDFPKIFKKPSYGGDFMKQLFDWNSIQEQDEYHTDRIKKGWNQHQPDKEENWDDFIETEKTIKYKAKYESRKWKKDHIEKSIKTFKEFDEEKWKE